MATIANWNGHTFEVSPGLIRGFTDLSIKGSCETTDKNSDKQKYVERKYGEIPEITMTIGLNAMTGVTDVFSEAMEFVQEATEGACAYFYLGTRKLIPAQMMLVSAQVGSVVYMPGQGDKWISCDVKASFKQGTKNDSSASSSGGSSGTGNKASVKTTSAATTAAASGSYLAAQSIASNVGVKLYNSATLNTKIGAVEKVITAAQSASSNKITGTGLDSITNAINKTSGTTSTSATYMVLNTQAKTSATTSKTTSVSAAKQKITVAALNTKTTMN